MLVTFSFPSSITRDKLMLLNELNCVDVRMPVSLPVSLSCLRMISSASTPPSGYT